MNSNSPTRRSSQSPSTPIIPYKMIGRSALRGSRKTIGKGKESIGDEVRGSAERRGKRESAQENVRESVGGDVSSETDNAVGGEERRSASLKTDHVRKASEFRGSLA